VLEFSCNRTSTVDVLVIAVQKAAEEVWWLMHSCSPLRSGGEHVVLQQKRELKMFEQRYCLGRCRIQEVLTEATSCRALVLLDTVSKPCGLLWEVFYDTLYGNNRRSSLTGGIIAGQMKSKRLNTPTRRRRVLFRISMSNTYVKIVMKTEPPTVYPILWVKSDSAVCQ
jgi:hypothetical protein